MNRLTADIKKILEENIRTQMTAGTAVLIKKDGEEICRLEEGYADLENKVPMKSDTIVRLYSMSKPITAAAAMIAVEKGLIDIEDPVEKYIDTFHDVKVFTGKNLEVEDADRPIKIIDVLTMTAGLSYGDDSETGMETSKLFQEAEARLQDKKGMTTREFAEKAGKIPLIYQPGTSMQYSIGADLMGAIIEKASGMTFGEFLKEQLFDPLGMKDSGFFVPEEKQDRLAKAYEIIDQKLVLYKGNNLAIRNTMDRPADFESGGAGMVSTVNDFAIFAQMLLNGGIYQGIRILQEESVKKMTQGLLNPVQKKAFETWMGKGFDYGWFMRVLKNTENPVIPGFLDEYGWDGWLGCYFVNCPRENMFVLIMQQNTCGERDLICSIKEAMLKNIEREN